jgi:hypothetical protein
VTRAQHNLAITGGARKGNGTSQGSSNSTDRCRTQRPLLGDSPASIETDQCSPLESTSLRPQSCNNNHGNVSLADNNESTLSLAAGNPNPPPPPPPRPTDRLSIIDDPPQYDFSNSLSYICRGYDPNARHFDGLNGVCNDDFLIDLDTNSMERHVLCNLQISPKLILNSLPDIRAYFFYVGYHAVHELRRNDDLDALVREQVYVTAGRLAMQAEKNRGHG